MSAPFLMRGAHLVRGSAGGLDLVAPRGAEHPDAAVAKHHAVDVTAAKHHAVDDVAVYPPTPQGLFTFRK